MHGPIISHEVRVLRDACRSSFDGNTPGMESLSVMRRNPPLLCRDLTRVAIHSDHLSGPRRRRWRPPRRQQPGHPRPRTRIRPGGRSADRPAAVTGPGADPERRAGSVAASANRIAADGAPAAGRAIRGAHAPGRDRRGAALPPGSTAARGSPGSTASHLILYRSAPARVPFAGGNLFQLFQLQIEHADRPGDQLG